MRRRLDPHSFLSLLLVEVTTLPNGLRIATQRTPDETVTVAVFVDSGSRYETKENNGVAHFLEHMVFKVSVDPASNFKPCTPRSQTLPSTSKLHHE